MRIFKKNFCSIKKIIDIFKFMLYRYNINIFYIVLHDLRIVINASSQTFQEGIALIESSFLVIIRLKHSKKQTKNAETFRMNHPSHDFLSISSCSPLSLALFQSPLSPSIFLANFFILGAKCLARQSEITWLLPFKQKSLSFFRLSAQPSSNGPFLVCTFALNDLNLVLR